MKRPRLTACILGAWVGLSMAARPLGSSSVTVISGRVEVPDAPRPVARRPSVAELGMPLARDRTDRRQSVVYLETAPSQSPAVSASRTAIDQRRETFIPHVLAVPTGTVVDFPNSDETYHNVFSLSRIQPFDLGRYAAGHSKSITFDQSGIARIFCDIHSHMSAFVLVFDHQFFAVTDDDGRYRLEGVPPGTYRLVAWNESVEAVTRGIVVPGSGEALQVDFVLRR